MASVAFGVQVYERGVQLLIGLEDIAAGSPCDVALCSTTGSRGLRMPMGRHPCRVARPDHLGRHSHPVISEPAGITAGCRSTVGLATSGLVVCLPEGAPNRAEHFGERLGAERNYGCSCDVESGQVRWANLRAVGDVLNVAHGA